MLPWLLTPVRASATTKGIHILVYVSPSYAGCQLPQFKPGRWQGRIDCETGALVGPGFTDAEWRAYTGAPVGMEPCADSLPGPLIANTCDDDDVPNECKGGPQSSDATADPAGQLGDPVDLSSGALELTPTDVSLAGVLHFTRHYASNRTLTGPMGRGWLHSLEWSLTRTTVTGLALPVFVVRPPLRTRVAFIRQPSGSAYFTGQQDAGSLSVDPDGTVHFRDEEGVEADFDPQDRLVALRTPSEPPIAVSYGTNSTTYTDGVRSLVFTTYPSGHANAGRVASVTADGETWTYSYDSSQNLGAVTGPNPSTPSTSDTITWTYVYTTPLSSGRVKRIDRTVAGVTTTLASWTYTASPFRVASADEPALEQALAFSYAVPQTNRILTTVKNASSQTLALFDHTNDMLLSVTNTSGPAAPVAGGAGVPVPFVSGTVEMVGTATNTRWRTKTDQNGNVTLFDDYDDHGRPQSIVEGWVDGPGAPGVFSVDDSWIRWREYTYHPELDEPLTVTEESVIPGAPDRLITFDYDDPLAPGDNPLVPNQSPTSRLSARIEQGSTLDASGAVVAVSAATRFTYDADGRVTSESGPRTENYTEHLYDSAGNRTATRRYLNGPASSSLETTFSSFDARGNPQTVTDPNGRITTFTYDTLDRVSTVTPAYTGGGSTISSTYDVDGNLVRVDFPNDSFAQPYFVRMGYDTKNRLSFLADSAGNAIVYERTAGRVTREALYSGFVDLTNRGTLKGDSSFGYDVAGRLLKAFNPLFGDGSVYSQYAHDGNGNQTSISDENAKLDNLLYDALDRLTSVQQIRGGTTYTTGYAYDAAGSVRQVTDPAGKTTDYQFDDLGRLVKVTSPNAGVTLYLYDLAGNLTTKKEDFADTPRTTLYTYDGLDRLTRVDFPSDADWIFTYDASAALNQKGRLSSVGNGAVSTELEYSDRGEIAVERTLIGGGSYLVTYGYDAAGNLTSLQTPSGVTSAYAYSAGRPKTVTVTAGSDQQVIRNLSFLPFGPRTRAEFPPYDSGTSANTVISTRSFNVRGQASALQVSSPLGTVLDQSFSYGYIGGAPGPVDGGPNLDQVTDNRDSSQSHFYFYDALDRLWKSTNLSGSPLYTYVYDANGNRTQQVAPAGTTDYTYQSSTDRVAQATGAAAKHYAHDAFGNRIWAGPSAYAGTPSHVYDQGNRLIEMRDPTTQAVLGQYSYDAAGRRVRKIVGGVTTLFFYDSAGHLVESQKLSTSPATRRSFLFVEDEPVGVVDQPPSGSPSFSWIHTDRIGAPLAVTNTPATGSAKTIWRASYEPFGLATLDEDPDGDSQAFALDLRFPGQVFDGESGLYWSRYRYYDARNGAYSRSEPLLGDPGFLRLLEGARHKFYSYAYALNDPIGYYDPDGLFARTVWKFVQHLGQLLKQIDDPGLTRPNAPQHDKFHHCTANCESTRDPLPGGQVAAWALDTAKEEIFDRCRQMTTGGSNGPDPEDWDANYAGQSAPPGVSCEDWCSMAYPDSGH